MKEFTGRVKSIEFDTGKVQIADKDKNFFYVRSSSISTLCALVVRCDYVTFELDGRIVESFKEHSY